MAVQQVHCVGRRDVRYISRADQLHSRFERGTKLACHVLLYYYTTTTSTTTTTTTTTTTFSSHYFPVTYEARVKPTLFHTSNHITIILVAFFFFKFRPLWKTLVLDQSA
jgi:cytochrome c oxidase assembly factor CtaG